MWSRSPRRHSRSRSMSGSTEPRDCNGTLLRRAIGRPWCASSRVSSRDDAERLRRASRPRPRSRATRDGANCLARARRAAVAHGCVVGTGRAVAARRPSVSIGRAVAAHGRVVGICRAGVALALVALLTVLSANSVGAAAAGGGLWVADRGDGTYRNPVLYADYSDPDVVAVGDDFYLTASSFTNVPGLPILHSRDLVTWRLVGHALQRLVPDEHHSTPRRGGGVWAPCLRYRAGRFVLYYPDPDFGVYRVTAEKPEGPWSEPSLVLEARGAIDPAPFWDKDGNAWLVVAWANSRAGISNRLTAYRMDSEGTRVVDAGRVILDGAQLPPVATSSRAAPLDHHRGAQALRAQRLGLCLCTCGRRQARLAGGLSFAQPSGTLRRKKRPGPGEHGGERPTPGSLGPHASRRGLLRPLPGPGLARASGPPAAHALGGRLAGDRRRPRRGRPRRASSDLREAEDLWASTRRRGRASVDGRRSGCVRCRGLSDRFPRRSELATQGRNDVPRHSHLRTRERKAIRRYPHLRPRGRQTCHRYSHHRIRYSALCSRDRDESP